MQVGTNGFPSVAGTHREFRELIVQAKAWDQTFESAIGTYPTREFAAGYKAFTDRFLRAQKSAESLGMLVSSDFGQLATHKLWHDYVQATSLVQHRLERMADDRTPFKPYAYVGDTPWGSLLDGMVTDLVAGERMLYAKLISTPPTTTPTPNPGVPTYPQPTYPGGPRPTPIP